METVLLYIMAAVCLTLIVVIIFMKYSAADRVQTMRVLNSRKVDRVIAAETQTEETPMEHEDKFLNQVLAPRVNG